MELSFIQSIVLYCLDRINGERTIYSILHLLNGKKSSQTIQDAHLFHLTLFYQTNSSINRTLLESTIKYLLKSQYIESISEQQFILTEGGKTLLNDSLKLKPIPIYLNGWKYQQKSIDFWEKLSLLTQVVSHLQNHKSNYLPVQRKTEVIQWTKSFLQKNKKSRSLLGLTLYNELVDCFENDESIDPGFLVIRLSGYNSIGLTKTQAATYFNMETSYYQYQYLNVLHYVIKKIENIPSKYPILNSVLDHSSGNQLTKSAEKTLHLLNRGYNYIDIISIRKLKKSTIEDHLVEIVLNIKDFSIEPYVEINLQQMILDAIKYLKTKQLKHIRSHLETVSYFQIRLVLAKYGDQL